jgi:hypothetical protein
LSTATSTKFQANLTNAWLKYDESQSALQSDDAQTLINALFEPDLSLEQIQKQLQEDSLLASFGLPTSEYRAMDRNRDGTLDMAELQELAKGRGGKPDIDAIASGKGYQGMDGIKTTLPQVPSYLAPGSVLSNAYSDGKVTADELASLDLNSMAEIFNAMNRPGEKGPATGAIAPAVRDAYLNALGREKNKVYGNLGLEGDGFVPGLKTTIADAFANRDAGKLRESAAVLQGTLDTLTREMRQATNPDLKWRIEQDFAKLKFQLDSVTGAANEFQKKPAEEGRENPAMGLPIGPVGADKVGTTVVEKVGGALKQGAKEVAKRIPGLGG